MNGSVTFNKYVTFNIPYINDQCIYNNSFFSLFKIPDVNEQCVYRDSYFYLLF